jgi:hypothetical protein
MEDNYHILDCTYPSSFISVSTDEVFARLLLLPRDTLLECVHRFKEQIPRDYHTKDGYAKLIRTDFAQQTNELIQLSTPDLLRRASIFLDSANFSMPRFLLVCQCIHDRYGTAVAPQLLCSQARWNPPEVAERELTKPAWFRTPASQLRSRLTKVESRTIKICCDLYTVPQ